MSHLDIGIACPMRAGPALTAVSASQADEVGRMKMELRRLIFEEQARTERRKGAGTPLSKARLLAH
jgi:hypothetical protein